MTFQKNENEEKNSDSVHLKKSQEKQKRRRKLDLGGGNLIEIILFECKKQQKQEKVCVYI